MYFGVFCVLFVIRMLAVFGGICFAACGPIRKSMIVVAKHVLEINTLVYEVMVLTLDLRQLLIEVSNQVFLLRGPPLLSIILTFSVHNGTFFLLERRILVRG